MPAINAYQAVLRATDNRLPPDIFDRTVSRNNSPEAANFLKVGRSYDLSIQDFADVDYYQIDVPPYSDVQIQLFYVPALGTLHLAPGRADWDKSLKPDGELITSSSVLEGKYEFSVYSPDKIPNIYDVSVNINPVGLQPDEFDIVPPYNNTIWNSGVLNFAATDNYGVTLHVPSDVDWYRFSVPSAPKSKFPLHFHLSMASDFAVATWIMSDKSTEPVFSDVTDSVDLSLPAETQYIVSVTAPKITRYRIDGGFYLDKGSWPDFRGIGPIKPKLEWINPGDPPIQFTVIEHPKLFVFTGTGRMREVRLDGENVHVELLDEHGRLLERGVVSANSQHPGERIGLENAVSGKTYVMRVEQIKNQGNVKLSPRQFQLSVQ